MRKAFSFAAGMLGVMIVILASIAIPALNPARFEKAVLNTVNRQAVGMSESDLTAFARDTMDYLRGETDVWQPQTPFGIPQSFTDHMAEVRGWVDVLKIALPMGALLAAAGLWLGRNLRAARNGMLCMLGLIAAVLLWAVIDFDSLWMVIHRVLIPGGIFPAGEPVMQLFPLSLFFSYILPVVFWLGVWLVVVGGIGWLMGLLVALCAIFRRSSHD